MKAAPGIQPTVASDRVSGIQRLHCRKGGISSSSEDFSQAYPCRLLHPLPARPEPVTCNMLSKCRASCSGPASRSCQDKALQYLNLLCSTAVDARKQCGCAPIQAILSGTHRSRIAGQVRSIFALHGRRTETSRASTLACSPPRQLNSHLVNQETSLKTLNQV